VETEARSGRAADERDRHGKPLTTAPRRLVLSGKRRSLNRRYEDIVGTDGIVAAACNGGS